MKKTISFVATACEGCGTAVIDLGATEAVLPIETLTDMDAVQVLAIDAVREGGLLKLDALKGADILERYAPKGLSNGEGFKADGWYGVIPAIQLAVGPFERKSQAMNGVVLALMGVELRNKQQKPEPVEVHIPDEEPTIHAPAGDSLLGRIFGMTGTKPTITPEEKAWLRSQTPEQLDKSFKSLRELAQPLIKRGGVFGHLVEESVEKTIADVKEAIFSA